MTPLAFTLQGWSGIGIFTALFALSSLLAFQVSRLAKSSKHPDETEQL